MLDHPVAFAIFRRPRETQRVFEQIRKARPRQLFVFADGPRPGNLKEAWATQRTRMVINQVDWPCEVKTDFSDENLGCAQRISSGLDWVFSHVDRAIILEDDCIPHPSFFGYCAENLERYADDTRVMHISGCTYREEPWDTPHSYFFSNFPACWGWATWRRAWSLYELQVPRWPKIKQTPLVKDVINQPLVEAFWSNQFDIAHGDGLYTWDYQWALNCWENHGLSIFPRHNLVDNIGFAEGATHTQHDDESFMSTPTRPMPLPLSHPPRVMRDATLDRRYVEEIMLPHATPCNVDNRSAVRKMVASVLPRSVKDGIRNAIQNKASKASKAAAAF